MRSVPALWLPLTAALLAILVLSVLLSLHDANAGGATFNVDTTADDPSLNVCTDVGPPDCSLRGAIWLANQSSTFNPIELGNNMTYTLDEAGAGENVDMTGDLDIENPININGHGSTIDADNLDRVFDLDVGAGTQIEFSNMTITGGNSSGQDEHGGGIRLVSGVLTLSNVTLDHNTTTGAGGGISVGQNFPTSTDASLIVTNSTISNNTASEYGGGIYKADFATSTFQVSDSEVTGNTGLAGGGLSVGITDVATITNTQITGNTATQTCPGGNCGGGGGGIYQGAGPMTITGGSISNNHSDGASGGAYLPNENALVSGVTISGNTADANIGGISIYGGTLINSIVTNNHAATTGGVQIHSGTISHTVIRDNVATGSIGGVFLSGEGQIDHSEISGNSAGADGGGVALAVKTPTITNSTISGNTAARGGGIFREPVDPVEPDPGTATLSFVTIADNTAGTGANVFGDNSNGVIHAGRSIIAYSHSGSDCNIALVSDDYNVEEGTSCMLNSANDVSGVDPLLGALANNGGPTKTRSLGANSPAVNRVPAQACPSSDDDQRGTSRPVGGACDSGAFESSFSSTATPSPSPSPTGSPVSQQKVWGDEDCGNDVDGADLAELLRWAAGIPLLTQGCFPALNAAVYVNSVALRWADLNCDTVVNAVDALTHVLVKAGLTPTLVGNGCPNLEDQVSVHD